MRDRAGKKYFDLGTDWFSQVPLAAVGKPYKLPGWSTACECFLALNIRLCELEHCSNSAWDCLSLFDLNRRTPRESAPAGREVRHF